MLTIVKAKVNNGSRMLDDQCWQLAARIETGEGSMV